MKTKLVFLLIALLAVYDVVAQPPRGGNPNEKQLEQWQVTVNTMDEHSRQKITELVESIQERGGATRGVVFDLLNIAKTNSVTTAIDVVSTEILNWANYRNTQKKEWRQMIDKENSYMDSLLFVDELHDFYSETSRYGALDPSNINFNGISVHGVNRDKEFMFLSCHIDTARMEHLFRHSKFYLVVDSISFNPFGCHLPNLLANSIDVRKNIETQRDNRFSFDEREALSFGMELSITSSWMNEAVMLQQNVALGTFKLNINIPSGVELYTYSRKEILANRQKMKNDPSLCLDTTLIPIEGDCFVVPRSYMPINGTEPMWGTGAYNIKVKFKEKCRFVEDSKRNIKYREWHKDYKQLRKMQKKNDGVMQSVRNLWKQNGNTMVKTIVRQYLTNVASETGLSGSTGGTSKISGGMSSGSTTGGMMSGNSSSASGGGKGPQGGMPGGK